MPQDIGGCVLGSFSHKVAIVTGGSAGIGRACVKRLTGEGARVIVADINTAAGESLSDQLGENAVFFPLDVRSEEQWQACVDTCFEKWGRLDVLVNNAGIARVSDGITPETITLDEWRSVNAVNTEGVVLGCKHAIAGMRKTGSGSIINMASVGGTVESPLNYPYGASKAAVIQITKTVGLYCARQGYEIRCNAVLPGTIRTELYMAATPEEFRRQNKAAVPVGRLGTPEQIASMVVYLASDEAQYITGAGIPVDGGLLAANPMRSVQIRERKE